MTRALPVSLRASLFNLTFSLRPFFPPTKLLWQRTFLFPYGATILLSIYLSIHSCTHAFVRSFVLLFIGLADSESLTDGRSELHAATREDYNDSLMLTYLATVTDSSGRISELAEKFQQITPMSRSHRL